MSEERYERAVDEVAVAARGVREAMQAWDDELLDVRRQRSAGVPMVKMLDRAIARGARVAADDAIAAYRNAVRRLRVTVVRTLVNSEGMTLTSVAKSLGISRQMASRLYGRVQPEVLDTD